MNKVLLLCLMLVATVFSATAQQKNCADFKTGNFVIKDSKNGTSYLTRTDKYQIEWTNEKKSEVKFNITWLDDCTYELTPSNKKAYKAIHAKPGDKLTVKIVSTSEYGYTIEATSNFFNGTYKTVVERVL